MLHFEAKLNQIRFRPQTPLGELTALPQTPYLDLRGPTSKGKGGRGRRKGKGEGENPLHYKFLATPLSGSLVMFNLC